MSESMIVGGVDLGDENLDLPPRTYVAVRTLAESVESILDGYRECRYQWEERGKKIEHQRRELARLNREHLQNLATIEGQNIGLAALGSTSERLESLISDLYVQIAVLETELGYPTPEQTGKHAANRHAEGPRTSAQAQGRKLHQCDSRATQDAIPDAALKAAMSVKIVDWLAEPLHLTEDEARDILNAALPEIRSQLATLIRARIDEDAAGKIHNDRAAFNRGIGINIGLERAAQTVEGRQR